MSMSLIPAHEVAVNAVVDIESLDPAVAAEAELDITERPHFVNDGRVVHVRTRGETTSISITWRERFCVIDMARTDKVRASAAG